MPNLKPNQNSNQSQNNKMIDSNGQSYEFEEIDDLIEDVESLPSVYLIAAESNFIKSIREQLFEKKFLTAKQIDWLVSIHEREF